MFEGTGYVGLVAFRMDRVGWLGLPGLPVSVLYPPGVPVRMGLLHRPRSG